MTFGERLKQCRNSYGFTQEQVAEKIGATRESVTNWEIGKREPNFDTVTKLSELFNVTIDYLVKGDGKELVINNYISMLKRGINKSRMSLTEICDMVNAKGFKMDKSYLSKLQTGSKPPASDELNSVLAETIGVDPLLFRTYAWLEKIPSEIIDNIVKLKSGDSK